MKLYEALNDNHRKGICSQGREQAKHETEWQVGLSP